MDTWKSQSRQQGPVKPGWCARSEEQPEVSNRYLRHNDVHLSTEFPQRVHQLLGVFVNSNPASIHKDLCGAEQTQITHTYTVLRGNSIKSQSRVCECMNAAFHDFSVKRLQTNSGNGGIYRAVWGSSIRRTLQKGTLLNKKERLRTNSAMAAGEISSRFSMLHSSRNSKMGDGWEPTEM